MYTPNDVSVIICTYTEERWGDLVELVNSIEQQDVTPLEIIVVIDNNPKMLERVQRELPGVVAVANTGSRGASSARNSGVKTSKGRLLVFLDDDALIPPRSNWLQQHCDAYRDSSVLGVGGTTSPLWLSRQPWWFPGEFNWVVGATYTGMPEQLAPVRNVWSCNMSIRRDIFDNVNGFRIGFGKIGKHSSPEDTDLCIRTLQKHPGSKWLFHPFAHVMHKVPANRATWQFFTRRCYNEGLGKAHLASLVGAEDGTTSERSHLFRTLPRGVARGILDTLRGDWKGLGRSVAIVVGTGLAVAGYLVGTFEVVSANRTAQNKLA